MKLKKRTKASRMHGKGMGSHGWGARKKHMGSGHRGGKGMAGSGKRADHNRLHFIVNYGNKYFGKQGFTSRGSERNKKRVVNIREIIENLDNYKKKFSDKSGALNFEEYKILGEGEIKEKINIIVKEISKSAKEKIEKAGGIVTIVNKKEVSKENNKKEK